MIVIKNHTDSIIISAGESINAKKFLHLRAPIVVSGQERRQDHGIVLALTIRYDPLTLTP